MLLFKSDRTCEACPHFKSAQHHRCIPTCLLHSRNGSKTCVLIVGERPGIEEDKQDKHFVGNVGLVARDAYGKFIFENAGRPIDVYGTNAVRCSPAEGDSVTESQASKCTRLYLHDDVALLKEAYDEIYILACGGPASKAIFGSSLGGSLRRQGERIDVGGHSVWGFCTFNPGVLLPGRDPGLSSCIYEHLSLLVDHIKFGTIPMDLAIPDVWGPVRDAPDDPRDKLISIDIETYGAIEGMPNQTVFHPIKSVEVDGCPRDQLIQTVAVSWEENGKQISRLFVIPEHRADLHLFLDSCVRKGYHFLGMNFAFDMIYLRTDPIVKRILNRLRLDSYGCRLMDLSVSNFLESDNRPEKSLKELAPLLRVHRYDEEASLKGGFKYESRFDPELHWYNVCDVAATLESHFRLVERAKKKYPQTGKFTGDCLDYYSDSIWTAIEMDEAGVAFNRESIEHLHRKHERLQCRLKDRALNRYGVKLAGAKSEATLKRFAAKAARIADVSDGEFYSKYGMTKKKGPCLKQDVLYYIVDRLPIGHPYRHVLRLRIGYKKSQKITSSYTDKLLNNPSRGLIGNMAYPNWYVVPSRIKDEDGAIGGTKQGRMTCSNPGLMTDPPPVRRCRTSRFGRGVLFHADLSQIELKVMAICSGDPVMIREYAQNLDRHALTGLLILHEMYKSMVSSGVQSLYGFDRNRVKSLLDESDGLTITKENIAHFGDILPGWNRTRHLGKTSNFLMGFRGGGETWQATVRRDFRLELDRHLCNEIVAATARKYIHFTRWQDSLVDEACKSKMSVVPVTGDTRTFAGSDKVIRRTYMTNIVNHPIQTIAAWIMKSAQSEISKSFQRHGLQSVCTENCYDAVDVDSPFVERDVAFGIIDREMTAPPFYRRVVDFYGNCVNLGHEINIVAET